MHTLVKRLLAVAVALLPAAVLASEFVVIANPSVQVQALSRGEVARIFTRLQTTWPGGAVARPVDQVKSAPAREAFSREILGKSVAAVEQYWTQVIFSGRAVPPVEKRSDAEVVAYVRENPGAIGYVSPAAATEGVKRLTVKD
jgi:ABC-type phosphate transport system substrate-binding protein